MRHEVRWDRTSEESAEDLRQARSHGQKIVSLCSYRGDGGPRHATVWGPAEPGLEQRFAGDVAARDAASVLARQARDGYHPALVGMVGASEQPLLAFVLERVAPGAPAPRFLPPLPFRDERGTFFLARAAAAGHSQDGYLRSLAAAGTPLDESGAGLLVAGVLAPQPPLRVAWAVHLDRVLGPWRERWEVRTLETIARPVLAIPVCSSDGARWVLSLWHDRLFEPWPAPDPFARARRFEVDEVASHAALADAVTERRQREDRRVIALGGGDAPGGARFVALYGARGSEATLRRRFVAVAPGEAAPACIVQDGAGRGEEGDEEATPEHPLDRWVLSHMRESGARQGQLVVVRGRRLTFAKAYTYAEAGYPVARLDEAMRLGSVSKALTAVALFAVVERSGLPGGLDTAVVDPALLDVAAGEASPRLASVTLRHLLAHNAGLKSFAEMRPDEPANPLSEQRLTALLDGRPGPARPGQLAAALRAPSLASQPQDEAFTRAPGGEAAAAISYSNEGFILLGELLSRLALGSFADYERAAASTLLGRAGIDAGTRGCLFGAGRRRAQARGEAPAHPSSPTWAVKRFAGDDLDEGPLVLAPYAENGPFLGGAAGWCVPLVWLARLLAGLGARQDGSALWQRRHLEIAAAPAAPGSPCGHGFHLGDPGFWTFRPSAGGAPLTVRVHKLHHNGRIEGGAALLIHLVPCDTLDDTAEATLSVAVAFNQLGALYADPHGRQLLTILRNLEGSPGWDTQDSFDRLDDTAATPLSARGPAAPRAAPTRKELPLS